MSFFVVHDDAGNIVRYGRCPQDSIKLQASHGETAIEGRGNDEKHCVWNGEVMLKAQATALGWTGHP